MALKNVVLPAPLGPIIPMNSPSVALRSNSLSASRPPKRTVSLLISRRVFSLMLLSSRLAPQQSPPVVTRNAVGQVEHRHDQQYAEEDQVQVGKAESQKF